MYRRTVVLQTKKDCVGMCRLGTASCSGHAIMEFRILYGRNKAKSRISTLDFRRVNFDFFADLLGRIPWNQALEGSEVQNSWLIFKDHFLRDQKSCIPAKRK